MNTITYRMAAALRDLLGAPSACDCGPQGCGGAECRTDQREAIESAARTTLAEYEAGPRDGDRYRCDLVLPNAGVREYRTEIVFKNGRFHDMSDSYNPNTGRMDFDDDWSSYYLDLTTLERIA